MLRPLLVLVVLASMSLLATACSQPTDSQIDSSQHSGRWNKVTLEIPTIV